MSSPRLNNPVLRWLHDKSVELDPGPHREVFLKPFHRAQIIAWLAEIAPADAS